MDEIAILRKRLDEVEARLERLESSGAAPAHRTTKKPQALREFINEKHPSTANDRALVMGYYLESIRGQENFNADDIKRCFREAKITPPANVNDVINKNIAKGYIMDIGERSAKKSWVLTATGEEVVIKGFKNGNKE